MASLMSVSTTDDGTDNSLPSFSTFSTELDPSWEFYDPRDRSSTDVITSQQSNSSYTRPWEMDTKDKGFEPFSKLPSFQSQFHSYSEATLIPEPSLPHQITPVPVPISPSTHNGPINGSATSLTQLTPIHPIQTTTLTTLSTPSFHTLTAVQPRSYPLVPAAIQARDMQPIQQHYPPQYLDDRHIQLYQPISTYHASSPAPTSHSPMLIKSEAVHFDLKHGGGLNQGPMLVKSEPVHFDLKHDLHHSNFINPMIDNGFDGKPANDKAATPTRQGDQRKKERRKNRTSSLESSAESDGSAMDMGDGGNPGQVAAISSTASFKSPMSSMSMGEESMSEKVRH